MKTYMPFLVAALICLFAGQISGQSLKFLTPDCCEQATQLKAENETLQKRLTDTQAVLKETRAVGDRIIADADQKLVEANLASEKRIDALTDKVSRLTDRQVDYDQLKDENARLKKQIKKPNFFDKVGKTGKDILAGIGAAAVLTTIITFSRP